MRTMKETWLKWTRRSPNLSFLWWSPGQKIHSRESPKKTQFTWQWTFTHQKKASVFKIFTLLQLLGKITATSHWTGLVYQLYTLFGSLAILSSILLPLQIRYLQGRNCPPPPFYGWGSKLRKINLSKPLSLYMGTPGLKSRPLGLYAHPYPQKH